MVSLLNFSVVFLELRDRLCLEVVVRLLERLHFSCDFVDLAFEIIVLLSQLFGLDRAGHEQTILRL